MSLVNYSINFIVEFTSNGISQES